MIKTPPIHPLLRFLVSSVIKPFKNYIDNNYRKKVTPIPGSVIYCDLKHFFEHSGIYYKNNEIVNIERISLFNSLVNKTNHRGFTDQSISKHVIYVSANKQGAVGSNIVAEYAHDKLGEERFYDYFINNCHAFSKECLTQDNDFSIGFNKDKDKGNNEDSTSGVGGISALKKAAKKHLGATKWLLWDLPGSDKQQIPKPDVKRELESLENAPLSEDLHKFIQQELIETREYSNEIADEIADEEIPSDIKSDLTKYLSKLTDIQQTYEKNIETIKAFGYSLSYQSLKSHQADLSKIVAEMANNQAIQAIIDKLGRNYVSEVKKNKTTLTTRNQSEVFGIHKSDDLVRLLPSELSNLEDPDLVYLFYSKLFEKGLATYQLVGKELTNDHQLIKGPIFVCVDTSGSMSGSPMIKAKALLVCIAKILEKEHRKLYILLFGSSKQIVELEVSEINMVAEILNFLRKSFNGGTDFDTPLARSIEIIESHASFNNADVLLISDGECDISDSMHKIIDNKKLELSFSIYGIICDNHSYKNDTWIDEYINI